MDRPPGLDITIDEARARRLARRLAGIETTDEHFLPVPRTAAGLRRTLALYLAWVGICQQTRTLEGEVDGTWFRGSDYLAHRFRAVCDADPERFSAGRLARLSAEELRGWFAPDGNPEHSPADRLAERLALLHDLGEGLLESYDGEPAHVIGKAKGRLAGPHGVLARLAAFRAYRDPARKKSFLLVLFLRGLGLYSPVDPEQLGLPVDYHILRIFLRSGVLRLTGARAEPLLDGGSMSEDEDVFLREMAVRAGRIMTSIVPLERLDLLLWMIGRNCCFYEHLPVCRTGPCTLADSCSMLASTDLDCGLTCPWAGVCEGSASARAAARREPAFDTDYY